MFYIRLSELSLHHYVLFCLNLSVLLVSLRLIKQIKLTKYYEMVVRQKIDKKMMYINMYLSNNNDQYTPYSWLQYTAPLFLN